MSRTSVILFFFICAFALQGCISSPYYQKEYSLPQNAWFNKNKPSFRFEVTDTTSLYNLFFTVRHTEAYPYSNIWLLVYTKKPGSKVFEQTRIEIPLADPSGKWLGRGMGEIWEQRMPITHEGDTAILNKKGVWEIRYEQNMRIDPLPEILQVGLRIEKQNKQ